MISRRDPQRQSDLHIIVTSTSRFANLQHPPLINKKNMVRDMKRRNKHRLHSMQSITSCDLLIELLVDCSVHAVGWPALQSQIHVVKREQMFQRQRMCREPYAHCHRELRNFLGSSRRSETSRFRCTALLLQPSELIEVKKREKKTELKFQADRQQHLVLPTVALFRRRWFQRVQDEMKEDPRKASGCAVASLYVSLWKKEECTETNLARPFVSFWATAFCFRAICVRGHCAALS